MSALWLLTASAWAQTVPSVPAVDAAGPAPVVDAVGLGLVPPVAVDDALVVRADLGVARDLLVWQAEDGVDGPGAEAAAVGTAWRLDLAAAAGFGPLRLGTALPLFVVGRGDLAEGGAAVAGDLRVEGKLDLLGAAGVDGPIGVGVLAGAELPLGAVAHGLGEAGPAGDAALLVDGEGGPLWAGVRGGVRFRKQAADRGLVLDEALCLAGGLTVEVLDVTWLGGEVAHEGPLGSPFSADPAAATELRGLVTRGFGAVRVQAMGGAGLGEGVGAPAWRAGLALTYGQPAAALAPPAPPEPPAASEE
ncbi:MAG: hypothetical protein H6742_00360 [Alphaproteobacteria bacterium]|nr:hypothetical protein [Alphaproteobacteria bacterium]